MLIFVSNLNILITLYLYNIHQSLIRKSVSLFEIMNAHIQKTTQKQKKTNILLTV